MIRLLVPLVLLLLGVGGGVGAGLALAPREDPEAALAAELADPCGVPPMADAHGEAPAPAEGDDGHGEAAASGHDYMALPNQFVVPLLDGADVGALMLLSLSVELPAGGKELVQPLEPKLRGALLQALFDQATIGAFDGAFTASESRRALRAALLDAAAEATEGLVTDVLVTEMVRQDR